MSEEKPKALRVKKLWEGKAALRDKYVKECIGKRDIVITNRETGEVMTLKAEDIKKRIDSVSKESFTDYYGAEPHRLVYFKWVKDVPLQSDLFSV